MSREVHEPIVRELAASLRATVKVTEHKAGPTIYLQGLAPGQRAVLFTGPTWPDGEPSDAWMLAAERLAKWATP